MADFKLYESQDGLVRTKIHGMGQDAFVVTEDKMNSFNNYSLEFQVCLTLFSVSLGALLGNLNDRLGIVFIVSSIITVILGLALIWYKIKFNKVKKNLFLKPDILLKENSVE